MYSAPVLDILILPFFHSFSYPILLRHRYICHTILFNTISSQIPNNISTIYKFRLFVLVCMCASVFCALFYFCTISIFYFLKQRKKKKLKTDTLDFALVSTSTPFTRCVFRCFSHQYILPSMVCLAMYMSLLLLFFNQNPTYF